MFSLIRDNDFCFLHCENYTFPFSSRLARSASSCLCVGFILISFICSALRRNFSLLARIVKSTFLRDFYYIFYLTLLVLVEIGSGGGGGVFF